MLGLDLLNKFIERLGLTKGPKLHVLLNAVSRTELTDTEQLLRTSEYGKLTLNAELYKSELLVAKPNFHLFPVDRRAPYSGMLKKNISAICAELATRLGV